MTYRIGMALLHFCWEGALIAAAFAIVFAMTRRARPETRYAAACATLVTMVAAPVVTFLRIGDSLVLPATAGAAHRARPEGPGGAHIGGSGARTPWGRRERAKVRIAIPIDHCPVH